MKPSWIPAAALAAALALPLSSLAQEAKAPAKDGKAAAKEGKPAAKDSVARVNGVAIPQSRMEYMVRQQQARGNPDSPQTRELIRDELVNREIIAQEAAKSGLTRQKDLQQQLDMVRQEIIVTAYLRDWVRRNPITDDEIQKAYDKAKADTPAKQYKARHILVKQEDEAKDVIGQLKKGAKFEDLAKKYSVDEGTKERGGDLDWTEPGLLDRAFADAMVKLEKGKYTETPVQTRFGYHVIQLDDVRATPIPTLAEVKPRIQQQLVQQKVEQLVKGLRAKAKVE